ncbi:MAG: hypothetical protein IT381_17620 [Deltaproteobacteria bacterium]|nr:hypothetical protein [Deltaproteobacteria bacterium]
MNALILTALFAAAPAPAAGWPQTFSADALATHLTGTGLRVVVITAGSDSPDAKAASSALEAALKATKKTRVVVSSASLGKFTDMDDEAIVKKVDKLPLDLVITVRTFDSDDGATVIVTIYDKSAEVLSAFSAEKGKRIAARSEDTAPVETSKASRTIKKVIDSSGGVSGGTASAKSPPPSGGAITGSGAFEAPVDTGNDAYDTKYIGFEQWIGINGYGQVVASWSQPYQGKYRRQLSNAEFYEIVERQDLADRYKAKQRLRLGLGLGAGLGGFVVGTTIMTIGVVQMLGAARSLYGSGTCLRYNIPTLTNMTPGCAAYDSSGGGLGLGLVVTGSILGVAGIVTGMVAMFMNPHPVKPHEAYALADQYNKRLRDRIENGESAKAEERESPDKNVKMSFGVTPAFGPQGGSIALGGTF